MKPVLTAISGLILCFSPAMAGNPQPGTPSPDSRKVYQQTARTWNPGQFRNAVALRTAAAEPTVFELPFNDTFQDGDATRANYTFLDVDNDGWENSASSVMNKWFWKEDERLLQHCVDQNAANDWVFTPAIHLDGKNIYKLTLEGNMGATSNIRVTVGKTTNPDDHREILDLNSIYSNWPEAWSTEFSVAEDANYYIGIYNYSTTDGWWFNLFSIDLQAGSNALVPQAPPSFTVDPDANGAIGATLRFTAPEKLANGNAITATSMDVNVYRNGDRVNTISCKPGETKLWHDDSPANGKNTYEIAAKNENGEGLRATLDVWVGVDKPKAPSIKNLTTKDKNMNVVIEWSKVTEGVNGAFFNPDKVTYKVYRGYSRNEMAVIAEGLTATTYTDTEIGKLLNGKQDAYFYGVAAVNEAQQNESAAKVIAVGKPLSFPEAESFDNGQLKLNPWLTDPIAGSFSWECVHDIDGVTAQDHDNGMSRFFSSYGGETDSRLKSPVFTLEGTKNPILSVWMFHWQDTSVEYDNGATRLIAEVCVDGGEWQALSEPLLAGYHTFGWVEHKFSLNDYKNAETVQFGLRGQTDNNWMYFFIDNIHFEEQPTDDIIVTNLLGSTEAAIDETVVYTVEVVNRGSNTAKGYTVELYRGDRMVASVPGAELAPDEKAYAELSYTFTAANVGHNYIKAVVNYDADINKDNNTSVAIDTRVARSSYPKVSDLKGTRGADGNVALEWAAPKLPAPGTTIVDGAESYEPWTIEDIGNWLTVDGDGAGSGCYTDLPKWPNCETNQAFIVWMPEDLGPEVVEAYPALMPYEGSQCFVSWLANVGDWYNDPVNDDYLISPEVAPASKVSFMVKGISEVDNDETFEVMYSSTGRLTENFTTIKSATATKDWEKIEVTLPEDARYFCIHYTASFQIGLMVDNIEYEPVDCVLELKGYDVFRNDEKINAETVANPSYIDTDAPAGTNEYRVSAVYDRGSSNTCSAVKVEDYNSLCNPSEAPACRVTTAKGCITIDTDTEVEVAIYRLDGSLAAANTVDGTCTVELPRGVYIVKAAGTVVKAAI